jgi:DNA polymerase III delta subunit
LVEKFDFLEGDEWESFIKREAVNRKIAISSQAVYFLARIFKHDSWGLVNELDKLVLLSKKGLVEPDDLKKIGDYGRQSPDIFEFIDRVVRNWPLPEKIIALERLFISQEEPVKIFNIMASLKRLPKDLLQKLADYDVLVKSGKIDYEEILLDLALSW